MNQADPGVRDHAPPGTERLLAGLTPEQAQAVTFGSGPLLLLAGPGAGKTRTLTHRAAYLLASGQAKPWEILAVTFSVRAAGELRLRLADLLAFAVRLLSEHPHRLAWLRQRWRWLLADEFQDTSHAQATLVDLLAGPDGNLCVCGDDDQLIHGWRHADPRHILCFGERHP